MISLPKFKVIVMLLKTNYTFLSVFFVMLASQSALLDTRIDKAFSRTACMIGNVALQRTGQKNPRNINCRSQLVASLNITNEHSMNTQDIYILISTIHDHVLHEEVILYNPLLIRLQQTKILLAYPFKFLQVINNKPYEIVVHKNNVKNFSGCSDTGLKPTCSYMYNKDGEKIPHSQGYCCGKNHQGLQGLGGDQKKESDNFSSAHCLQFDPVWYTVNKLKPAKIIHTVRIHIFQSGKDEKTGKINWKKIGDQRDLVAGSQKPFDTDVTGKVLLKYKSRKVSKDKLPIDYLSKRLLIPVPGLQAVNTTEQLKENASEYLLLNKELIESKCGKAGVFYEAFALQPNKCIQPAEICLENQPMHFWLHDMKMKLEKKKGKYFLSNFAVINSPAVAGYNLEKPLLLLQQNVSHFSRLHIQVKADSIQGSIKGAGGKIEGIYIRYLADAEHELTVHIFNSESFSSIYVVVLSGCYKNKSHSVARRNTINPHKSRMIKFHVKAYKHQPEETCKVELLNYKQAKVAERSISFIPQKLCICLVECACTCGSKGVYTCVPTTQRIYKEQGFFDTVFPFLPEAAVQGKLLLFFGIIFLLKFGLIKVLLGFCFPVSVGQAGLCLFIKGRKIHRYQEKDLCNRTVCYSASGAPVHPETKKPVRALSYCYMSFLNCFFFCYLPFIWIHWIFVKCYYRTVDSSDDFKTTKMILPLDSSDEDDSTNMFWFKKDLGGLPVNTVECILPETVCTIQKSSCLDKDLAVAQYKKKKKLLKYKKEKPSPSVFVAIRKSLNNVQHSLFSSRSSSESSISSFASKNVYSEPVHGSESEKEKEEESLLPVLKEEESLLPVLKEEESLFPILKHASSEEKVAIFEPPSTTDLSQDGVARFEPDPTTGSAIPSKLAQFSSESLFSESESDQGFSASFSRRCLPFPWKKQKHGDIREQTLRKNSLYLSQHDKMLLKKLYSSDLVYCSYDHMYLDLKNCGTMFSLCGQLVKRGKIYIFELGNYNKQTYESTFGLVKPLTTPIDIPDVEEFSRTLHAKEVIQIITLSPKYPCLNAPLDM